MEFKPLAPAVVTNPPYKLANEFVIKCMDMKLPYFAMLLRLAFLEGKQRRAEIYNRQPPAVSMFSLNVLQCGEAMKNSRKDRQAL